MVVAVLEHLADLHLVGDLGRIVGFRVVVKALVGLDRLCGAI